MTAASISDHTERLGDIAARALALRPGIAPAADPIPEGETAGDRAERLRVQARNRASRYLRQRPPAFAAARMDDVAPEHRQIMLDWLASRSRTLVITGPVGVGKSHAAYALATHAMESGITAAAWTVPDLLVALAPDGDGSAAYTSRTVPLLLLDDLGVEKSSEWRVEQITGLADARIRSGLRQIITTNVPYPDLAARYGDRIMSRLTGGAILVQLTGPDRRRVTW